MFGEMTMPLPMPAEEQRQRDGPADRRARDAGQHEVGGEQADDDHRQPHGDQRPAEAVDDPAAERRRDGGAEGERRDREAGLQRGVAAAVLQVQGEDEEDRREAGEVHQRRSQVPNGVRAGS